MKISIDEGLNELFDAHLGISKWHKHKIQCALIPGQLKERDVRCLLSKMISQMEENHRKADPNYPRSLKNWRLERREKRSEENKSKEIILERLLVNDPDDTWYNQVPTSSGLFHTYACRRNAIDLVHQLDESCYELIELKVDSDCPVYAAREILRYGVIYLFTRIYLGENAFANKKLSYAKHIRLVVLAPRKSFVEFMNFEGLSVLEDKLNEGLSCYHQNQLPELRIDFQFQVFSDSFENEVYPNLISLESAAALGLEDYLPDSRKIKDGIRRLFPGKGQD